MSREEAHVGHEALAEQDRLRIFVDTAPIALAMFDKQMRYLHVSNRWRTDLGMREEDLRGKSHYELFPEIPERWKEIHRRCLNGEIIRSDEDRFERADGRVQWLRWEVRPWHDRSGSQGGILIYMEEITERKKAQEDRARLAAIVESSEDAIVSKNLDGTIVTWNDAAHKIFGHTAKEAIGRSINLIVPPDRLEEESEILRRLARGERLQHYETVRITKDGRRLDVSLTFSPIRNHEGQVIAISKIARDISAQKKSESALKQREALLKAATDNAAVGLVLLDRERRYSFSNAAYPRILSLPWTASELVGKTPIEVLGEVYVDQIAPRLDRAYSGEHISYELTRFLSNDKSQNALQYIVAYDPMFDNTGNVESVIVTIFDITERKRAEEERHKFESHLQHAQKLESLGVLAGGIAHDFNNLLTSILGYIDLAMQELPRHSPARPLIAEAVNGARKAADLTQQMLAYSGKGRFVVEALNLNEVIKEMIHLLQVSISKKCVLKLHLAPEILSVEADAVQIRQVIMNLIINASDAIGDRSGVIALTTGLMHCDRAYLSESYLDDNLAEGFYVYLEVADTGCGMTEATRTKIFDPFFTTKEHGRGLGLAAVIGIVRGHRGALKVYSEVGKGTTFKFVLPASELPSQLAPADDQITSSWKGSGTVLVVDDEEAVRGLVRFMLEKMGFTVLTAVNGREGVTEFKKSHLNIDLVIVDMTMPHLDGAETFRELRRIRSDVKVILTSGYNEQTAVNQFAGKGLAAFIQKPFRYDDLFRIVRRVLGDQP